MENITSSIVNLAPGAGRWGDDMVLINAAHNRCCCGKFDDVSDGDLIHNDIQHQLLGPPGNFCGPQYLHTIQRLEAECATRETLYKEAFVRNKKLEAELAIEKRAAEHWESAYNSEKEYSRIKEAELAECTDKIIKLKEALEPFKAVK